MNDINTDPDTIREQQAKINAEYGIDQGGYKPVGDTITRAPKISITHPIKGGFAVFECEKIGVIYTHNNLQRLISGKADKLCEGGDSIIWVALQNGNAIWAEKAFRGMNGVTSNFGDYALKDIFDTLSDSSSYGIYESTGSGIERLLNWPPNDAFIIGDIGVMRGTYSITVCKITDATVCGGTWTPTDEEAAFIDKSNADAAGRISFARYVVENGSLAGALFAALGDY